MSRVTSLRGISLRSGLSGALGVAIAASFLACGPARSTEQRTGRFPIAGTVTGRDEIRSQLTIQHDAVAGLMPAMTMPFRVANLNPSVNLGDKVKGTLIVTEDSGWMENLIVTHKSDRPVAAPANSAKREPGAEVPDFAMRNQDGRLLTLRSYRGQSLILTFIFTRCPFPDYCPLMMKNFNAVKRELAARPDLEGRVHLLSVSIDPEYDTPAVLLTYGKRTIHGKNPFENWDLATPSVEEIGRMAGWFGLIYSYQSGQITHSLVTAVIDPNGRLVRIFPANSWKPEELVATVSEVTRRAQVAP
jgi:protein SCO1